MTARDRLDEIQQRAEVYSALGFVHEGDCAGSLCTDCGHCLHSITTCDHECSPGSGCADAVDDDEVVMKRDALALVGALRAVLDLHAQRWAVENALDYCGICIDNEGAIYPCRTARAITEALS